MLIVRPGFEKTETTALQEAVFSRHPKLLNLGRPVDLLGEKFRSALQTPDGDYDDEQLSTLARHVRESSNTAMLSDEHLLKTLTCQA